MKMSVDTMEPENFQEEIWAVSQDMQIAGGTFHDEEAKKQGPIKDNVSFDHGGSASLIFLFPSVSWSNFINATS